MDIGRGSHTIETNTDTDADIDTDVNTDSGIDTLVGMGECICLHLCLSTYTNDNSDSSVDI